MLFFKKNSEELKKSEIISSLSFESLYENISKVYDIIEEERAEKGIIRRQELFSRLKNYVIFSYDFFTVAINDFDIDENGVLILQLNFYVGDNFHNFAGNYYDYSEVGFEDFFTENVDLNGPNIEEVIKKRLDVVKKILIFQENGYNMCLSNDLKYMDYPLIKSLPIEKQSFDFGNKSYNKKIGIIFKYLESHYKGQIIESGYNEILKSLLLEVDGEKFRISHCNEKLDFWTNAFDVGLYVQFLNMELEQTEQIYDSVKNVLKKIENLIRNQEKLNKIVDKGKKELMTLLRSPGSHLNNQIGSNIFNLQQKYKNLEENGDSIYSPIYLEVLEDFSNRMNNTSSYDFAKFFLQSYLDLLQTMQDNDFAGVVLYYMKRLEFLYEKEQKFIEKEFPIILEKLSKLPENQWLVIFYEKELLANLSIDSIDMIMMKLSQENRRKFISNIYKNLIDIDESSNITLDKIKKYKYIQKYDIKEKIKESYYGLVKKLIVEFLIKNPEFLGDKLSKAILALGIEESIGKFSDFMDRYRRDIHFEAYKYILNDDSMDVSSLDISILDNMVAGNKEDLMTNFVVPYIAFRFHTMEDKDKLSIFVEYLKNHQLMDLCKELDMIEAVERTIKHSSIIQIEFYCQDILTKYEPIKNEERLGEYNNSKLNSFSKDYIKKILNEKMADNDELRKKERDTYVKAGFEVEFNEGRFLLDDDLSHIIPKYINWKKGQQEKLDLDDFQVLMLIQYAKDDVKLAMVGRRFTPDCLYPLLARGKKEIVEKIISFPFLMDSHIMSIIATHPDENVRVEMFKKYKIPSHIDAIALKGASKNLIKWFFKLQSSLSWQSARQVIQGDDKAMKELLIKKFKVLSAESQIDIINTGNKKLIIFMINNQDEIKSVAGKHILETCSREIREEYITRFKLSEEKQLMVLQNEDEIMCLILLNSQSKLHRKACNYIEEHGTKDMKLLYIQRYNMESSSSQEYLVQDSDTEIVMALLEKSVSLSNRAVMYLLNSGPISAKLKFIQKYDFKERCQHVIMKDSDERVVMAMLEKGVSLENDVSEYLLANSSFDVVQYLIQRYSLNAKSQLFISKSDEVYQKILLVEHQKELKDGILPLLCKAASEKGIEKLKEALIKRFTEGTSNIMIMPCDEEMKAVRELIRGIE